MHAPKKNRDRPILCLDFDGVLHWYRNGWQGQNVIDDEPVPGAVEFVKSALEVFSVTVYSSRSSHPGGIEAMRAWMQKHGFPEVKFSAEKPAAFLTIDDRALLFTGSWPDPHELRRFRPWTRERPGARNASNEMIPTPENSGQLDEAPSNGIIIEEEETMLKELVRKSRSVRRFEQSHEVPMDTLRELVELARLSPSGSNLQSLKYVISNDAEKNATIFEQLAWAGYLKDWAGPEEGERPSAYIIILGDSTISKSFGCDHGITAQTMMLGAAEKGLGGCIVGSVRRAELTARLQIPPQFEILLVLALGKPKEEVVIEPIAQDGSVRYWRDEQEVHHVPKRALDDLILE